MNNSRLQLLIILSISILFFSVFSCSEETSDPVPENTNDTIPIEEDTVEQDTTTNPPDTTENEKDSSESIKLYVGTFTLVNANSGKVLDIRDASQEKDANVYQFTANQETHQKFRLSLVSGTLFYKIVNVNSGLALSVENRDVNDGDNIVQKEYLLLESQQWEVRTVNDSLVRILNRKSGKALEVYESKPMDGANVVQWTYTEGAHQHWQLTDGEGGRAHGQLKWRWVSENVPQEAYDRITASMNEAVERYNRGANWHDRMLTVEYNPGVATADANIAGHIRFGPNSGSQNVRVALHELCHTWGVGTSSKWRERLDGGAFIGENAQMLIQLYDGQGATISSDGTHFWPYGLNFNNEWSEEAAHRHVELVSAMVLDGIY